jgi:hypothetical protein
MSPDYLFYDQQQLVADTASLVGVVKVGTALPFDTIAKTPRKPLYRFPDADTLSTSVNFTPDGTGLLQEKLFAGHMLKPTSSTPVPVETRNPDWFTIVLLLIVAAFAWIRVFYYKIVKQLFSAFFSNTVSNQIVRDENILVQRASIMLSFIFYLTASLFVYKISVYYHWDYPILGTGFTRFLIFSLLLAFTYSFKMVLLKGLGEVFDIDKPVATYIFNIFLINNIMGLVLIPIVLTIAFVVTGYTGWVVNGGIFLVASAFVYRLVRAAKIWNGMHGVSFFYLFLYFCTLEFAPLLILIKIAKG